MIRIASFYEKGKAKLNEAFDFSRATLAEYIAATAQIIRSFKYGHSLAFIRHLYEQEVAENYQEIAQEIHGKELGDRFIKGLDKFTKGVLTSFKFAIHNLGTLRDLDSL